MFLGQIDFEAVAHVEDFVHLLPVRSALLLNGAEEGRDGEHVVLHHAAVFADEVEHLCLGTACAVYHAVDERTQTFVEHLADHRGIGAGGGENEFPGIDGCAFHFVLQGVAAAIDEFLRHILVETFGIFHRQILAEHVVACAGQSVRAHAAVVRRFVGGLSSGRKSHDDVAGADVGIVDDIAAAHTARHGRIDDDGAHQVAHVGRLAARGIDADAHVAQLLKQFVGAVDDGRDHFARHEHLVAPDGAADQDVIDGTHAEQVVCVHDEGVLGNASPHRQVARFLPIHVGQARLRAGPVGVHDVAPLGVAAQDVGNDFAESLRKDTFVNVLDGVVHILLGGTHAAHHVALLFVHEKHV